MQLIVISPEHDHPRERAVLAELFAAGLERFHVRKPHASVAELEAYLTGISVMYRSRVILHQHHELVDPLGLGGRHWRDDRNPGAPPVMGGMGSLRRRSRIHGPDVRATVTSRSCHDLATLHASFGHCDSVFFGPVFPSISKPGYGPTTSETGEALGAILHYRRVEDRRTAVIAIGGIDVETAPRALALGFDGVAVLGAIWQADDPVGAFRTLQQTLAGRGPRSGAREPDGPARALVSLTPLACGVQSGATRPSRSTR